MLTDCNADHPFVQPPDHDFGPNFKFFGFFEHPVGIAKNRMWFRSIAHDTPIDFDCNLTPASSGRMVLFFSTILSGLPVRAIVSLTNMVTVWKRILSCFQTFHPTLLKCVQRTGPWSFPARVPSYIPDCKSVIDQFQHLILTRDAPPSWSHLGIYMYLALLGRGARSTKVDPGTRDCHGTTVQSIRLNRIAEAKAKEVASSALAIGPDDFGVVQQEVFRRQIFLAKWNRCLGLETPQDSRSFRCRMKNLSHTA